MDVRRVLAQTLILLMSAGAAHAQPREDARSESRYPWRYHRFDVYDYAVTATAAAGFLYVQFGVDPPTEAKWTSTSSFDDKVRSWMRAESLAGRDRADKVSDVFWYLPMASPYLNLLFPLLGDSGNTDTAWQMTAINIEAFAVSGFISRAGHRFAARQRPDVDECRRDPDYNGDRCFTGSFASFPSGHTSSAAVGAGLVCSHHLGLGLLGSEVADGLACGTALSMAFGAGVARIVADRHYVSDVLSGAAIGLGSGIALPLLRHYRVVEQQSQERGQVRWTVVPTAQGRDGMGLAAFGWF